MNANCNSVTPEQPAWVRVTDSAAYLEVHVQPGARRSQVIGEHAGRLKIAVNAPALDGRANHAVIELIAERLGVRRSALRVVSGERSRDKRIELSPGSWDTHDMIERLRPK